jgi:hypothetical protein
LRDGGERVASEGLLVGEQLVTDDADGEDVGAGVDGMAQQLFRRHVPRRADDRRHAGRQTVDDLGDAEIEDLEPPRAVDQQIARLDVAMDHVHLVRRGSPGAHLLEPADLLGDGHRSPALDDFGQRVALEVLHDDVRLGGDLAEVVDRDDVGVVEGGGGTRFAREALRGIGDVEVAEEDLDGHHAPEHGIVGHVHDAHAPARELALNFVAPDLRPGLQHEPRSGEGGREGPPRRVR